MNEVIIKNNQTYSLCETDSILIDKNGNIIEWLVYDFSFIISVMNEEEELFINEGEKLILLKDLSTTQQKELLISLIEQGISSDEQKATYAAARNS
jgi:hypothetical protein